MGITASTGTWSIGSNWPWPQMVFTSYYNLGFAIKDNNKLALYELTNTDNVWTATEKVELGHADNIVNVDVADFETYYMVAVNLEIDNIVSKALYGKSVSAGTVSSIDSDTIPAGSSCCNFNGQLIIGGLYSAALPWYDVLGCSVAWSDVGSNNMDPETYRVAGYTKMDWDENGQGEVFKVLPLGDVVRVYGDRGIGVLKPFVVERTTGFGKEVVDGPGVLSSDAIAGTNRIHGYVDTNYDWWIATAEGTKNLGYRAFMQSMSNRILVRYDRHNGRFYISDGVYGFVFNKRGMYSTHQCVSSIGFYKGVLCGFVKSNADTKIRLVTTASDFGFQSHKTIESVETGVVYDTTADEEITGAVSLKYDYKGAFTQLSWTALNERGIFTQKATGREFKLHLRADYESGATFSLNSLVPRIKFSDKRNIRGRLNVS